ncbi:MAG TPA: nitrous oxide reductase family maturation protein NosD [Verrucomicrobiae bacterium]|nr:nitrous oxide reductase family maturation protein NosD [Verrucomicrobiae bacterium]
MFWLSAVAALSATIPATDSISHAIARAQPGDTILVSGPRVFHERVVIDKLIELIGTNSPTINAGNVGTPLIITAPDCEVRGLVIQNSGSNLTTFDSGIMITAPRASVRDCRIESDAFGIYVRGVDACVIDGNEILGRTNLPSAARGNGIHVWKSRNNRILNNVIHDKRDGMYFSYANDNLISGNRVYDSRFGIHYMYSHQNRLVTNSLTRNAVGATLMFSRQLVVEGNTMIANRRHGLVLKQIDNSQILRNVVAGQNRGLFVQQANQNRFEGNLIATNDIGLYLSNASEQNVFVGNAFVRNSDQIWQPPFETEQGRHGPNTFSERGRGNFWSDYTGSDRDHDGIGDTPYHETDVYGYIVDRHPEARVLALSPALTILRKGEELMPLLNTTGVTDFAPLMNLPNFSPTHFNKRAIASTIQ